MAELLSREQSRDSQDKTELLHSLESERKQFESEGDFLKADKLYKRSLQVRDQIKREEERELLSKHESEASDLDKNFNEDFSAFNSAWDGKLEEYKQHCQGLEEELRAKQTEEFERTQKSLEESIPVIPKHSSEFLNLKKIQDTLVRNKEYQEAHAIQQKLKFLEEDERKNWGKDRDLKIQMALNALTKRQENELMSFKQKAVNGLNELKKKRASEMECYVKRYHNIKKELGTAHSVELNKFAGKHTTGSGLYQPEASIVRKLIYSPLKSKS